MKIVIGLDAGKLYLPGKTYSISNRIRTLKEGTRETSEVIRSVPNGLPYDPHPFPKGIWKITGVEWNKTLDNGKSLFDYKTYGPVKIKTDAYQWVKVWELDAEGDYLKETGQEVIDMAYWLHYTSFNTTLGCIRFDSPDDAIATGTIIEAALQLKEEIKLEVI